MEFTIHRSFPPGAVAAFADLKLPRQQGTFIAESDKIVQRSLESNIEIISLYLTEEQFEAKEDAIVAHMQAQNADIFIASKKSMEKVVGFTLHQGILATCRIPKEKSLAELITHSDKPQLFVILNAIADAENIGSLFRTALAMGATAIIVDELSVSPWIRRAVRVAMGATFKLPTITMELGVAISGLLENEIPVYAATIGPRSQAVWETKFRGSTAVVFGSEGHGVSAEVVAKCSGEIMIPMQNSVSSFNVGVAQGMVLYEIMRQRNGV